MKQHPCHRVHCVPQACSCTGQCRTISFSIGHAVAFAAATTATTAASCWRSAEDLDGIALPTLDVCALVHTGICPVTNYAAKSVFVLKAPCCAGIQLSAPCSKRLGLATRCTGTFWCIWYIPSALPAGVLLTGKQDIRISVILDLLL